MPDSAASATPDPPTPLADSAWSDVPDDVTLLVPVGSLEQHGPHLPLDTDTVIAVATSAAAARRCGGTVRVAPAVAYGASGEHEDFPGTVSVGTEALAATLVEIGRSARRWAGAVMFVNGHGGNVEALTRAVSLLTTEGAAVSWLACRSGEGHAGRGETSLLLHLAPQRVRLDRAGPGNVAPMTELLPRLRVEGVRAVSANGVLGDPGDASAAEGAEILGRMTDDVVAHVADRRGAASRGR